AERTMSRSTPPSRALYGANSRPTRRRFARRTAGSAGRTGAASEEWKNMPIGPRVRFRATVARFRYVVCDVFTDTPLAGNQLAVFTDARGLPEATLQPVARAMDYSGAGFR